VDLSLLQHSKLPFSLFPGQIVALEGLNATSRKLVVERLVSDGVPHPPMKTSVRQLLEYYPLQDSEHQRAPLKVMTVCGPYTTSTNLEYEPLDDLLANVRMQRPDVVILTGPFVDMNHPQVKNGMTKVVLDNGQELYLPFDAFFAMMISAKLEDLYVVDPDHDGKDKLLLQTQFVIVPSLDDATAEWVYPQPPFQDRVATGKTLDLPGVKNVQFGSHGFQYVEAAAGRAPSNQRQHRRVHLVSNPCTFQINEIVFGVTSTDVLFHVSADETNASLEPFSRLPRLAQHLLQQRNYYPLFPPHPSVSLDLKRMHWWSMPCRPDVLILPSKLQCMAKTVLNSTVVINPGRLTRDTTGGTYAVMEIYPMARETLEAAMTEEDASRMGTLLHSVPDRIRVEIKNI
jgi:DNA polymerase alpha subunit B